MSAVSLYSNEVDGCTYVSPVVSKSNRPSIMFSLKPEKGKKYENTSENNILGVITQIDMTKGENVSITPTIGSSLYLFVGGESVWDITISGVGFVACKYEKQHGFDNAIEWYLENNITKTGKAIEITIGKQHFKGYLVGFRTQVVAKASNLAMFSFKMYAVKSQGT